jgi:hypothetical protein
LGIVLTRIIAKVEFATAVEMAKLRVAAPIRISKLRLGSLRLAYETVSHVIPVMNVDFGDDRPIPF